MAASKKRVVVVVVVDVAAVAAVVERDCTETELEVAVACFYVALQSMTPRRQPKTLNIIITLKR